MQLSSSYIYSYYQKFICPRCEFLLNTTIHIPIVAPCGHTFCCVCLEEEFLEKNKFRCDLCKAETSQHYSTYPKNLYILSIRKNKIKNEKIYVGGKSPIMIKNNNTREKFKRSISSALSLSETEGKNSDNFYSIENSITYQYINNNFEIIKREVDFDYVLDPKGGFLSDFSNKKKFRQYGTRCLDDDMINNNNKKLFHIFEDDLKTEIPKTIVIKDFYGDGKKYKYPPLYNYTELLKKIYKYQDKYVKKYFSNTLIIFIFRVFAFFALLFMNIYLIKYIDVAFFYLFVCILLEKENTIYEIASKIKMLLALSCFYFVENIVKSLGFKYLIDMSSYISNISSATRTLFNILVLGNDSTLNLVVFIILNILSNLHLLLN